MEIGIRLDLPVSSNSSVEQRSVAVVAKSGSGCQGRLQLVSCLTGAYFLQPSHSNNRRKSAPLHISTPHPIELAPQLPLP